MRLTTFADTRRERVAHLELAAPDLGLQLHRGQAAVPVGIRERREAGLADEVGLRRADRRDVQLSPAHHRDRDADGTAAIGLVAEAVPVPLVGEALVRDRRAP